MTEEKVKARRRDLARWLKEGLLRLGPTFIKIGQQFSTRSDLLQPEYVTELSELQVREGGERGGREEGRGDGGVNHGGLKQEGGLQKRRMNEAEVGAMAGWDQQMMVHAASGGRNW